MFCLSIYQLKDNKFSICLGINYRVELLDHMVVVFNHRMSPHLTNICQQGFKKTGTLLHCWQECKIVQLLRKNMKK